MEGDTINFASNYVKLKSFPANVLPSNLGEQKVIGAESEFVVPCSPRRNGNFPVGGYAKRGKDAGRRPRVRAIALLNDPKEIAEHNMMLIAS